MKIDILDEPELEFGGGQRHVDIRFGLTNAGPLDVLNVGPRSIRIGIVGTHETVEGLSRWLERCHEPIEAKESEYPHLFPRFPGFRSDTAFRSALVLEERMQRTIADRAIARVTKAPVATSSPQQLILAGRLAAGGLFDGRTACVLGSGNSVGNLRDQLAVAHQRAVHVEDEARQLKVGPPGNWKSSTSPKVPCAA